MTCLMPASDTNPAAWVVAGIRGFAESVLSLAPGGFASYVRLFHPAYTRSAENRTPVRWSEIAAAKRTLAHPEMQFCALIGVHRFLHVDPEPGVFDEPPEQGSLPREVAGPLAAALRPHTATPDHCWFAAWSGFGDLRPDVRSAPEFGLPAREYHLLRGPLEAATESVSDGFWDGQSPNLWWPDDRAWCVATEIDLNTTYIGCSEPCRDDILALPDFEAVAIDPAAGAACDSDRLNPRPRGGEDVS